MAPRTSRRGEACPRDARDRRAAGVAVCAVAQNLAFGIVFGSFGPLLPEMMRRLGITLISATMAISLTTLTIAIGASVAGWIVQRLSARVAMIGAAMISACCYAVIAVTTSFSLILACYAILGLCGVTLGISGPLTLVSQWFAEGRGRMLGLIHMPILLVVMPVAVAGLLPAVGYTGILYGAVVAFLLVLLPIYRFAVPAPAPVAGVPFDDDGGAGVARLSGGRRLICLLLLSPAVGIVSGGSVAYMAHAVPFGLQRGLTLSSASLLISLYSASGVIGSPVTGWLSDRIGPYWTSTGAAVSIAVLWLALFEATGPAVFVAASLLGFFAAPINTMHAAALSAMYPPAEVGKAMGLSYLVKLPLLFGLTPMIALIVAQSGSYLSGFGTMSILTFVAAALHVTVIAIMGRLTFSRFSRS